MKLDFEFGFDLQDIVSVGLISVLYLYESWSSLKYWFGSGHRRPSNTDLVWTICPSLLCGNITELSSDSSKNPPLNQKVALL